MFMKHCSGLSDMTLVSDMTPRFFLLPYGEFLPETETYDMQRWDDDDMGKKSKRRTPEQWESQKA